MHKVGRDTLKLKRWLRIACDRFELMPIDMHEPLGVDHGTWGCWTSLIDERFVSLGMVPTILAGLDAEARTELHRLLDELAGPPKEKGPGSDSGA